jgi:hypothetical protein
MIRPSPFVVNAAGRYDAPMTTRPLFVTPLYEASLAGEKGFEAFIDELHDACIAVAEDDEAGQAWAETKGYLGYTSYASLDDLPQRDSLFADLKKKLDKHALAFAKDLRLRPGRRQAGDGQLLDQHPQAGRPAQRPHPSPQRASRARSTSPSRPAPRP